MFCRKKTKKKAAKVGRKKKEKTTAAPAEQTTPRTRGALAREAAAKAKREAKGVEMKAAAAREAAEAASREEVEATRNDFASSVPEPSEKAAASEQEPPLEPMALAVINAPEPIQTTPQQKGHCLQHLFPNINSFVQCVYLFSWQGTILRW